ncbi:retrotransposon protein, putative, ty1-copia subclass [Tanacetum coccineum]
MQRRSYGGGTVGKCPPGKSLTQQQQRGGGKDDEYNIRGFDEPLRRDQWTTLYDAHTEIACLMLGSMTPELHRQFELYYPFDMIQELRSMFEKQAGVEKFDLIQSFHACKQEESKPVADYVLKMKGYVEKLERLESATRILNMVPTKKVDKTPYELWYEKVPNLSYLKVWGCEALVKRDTLDKLEQRSVKCIFIGYPKETMGYYFYFPPENKIVVARYAEFFEKHLISQEISGRAVDLEEIQEEEDTTPSEITSNIPQEVEGFEPPQKIGRASSKVTNCNVLTESEYIAASEATMEAIWIRKFISGHGIVPTINEPLNMYCDNSAEFIMLMNREFRKAPDTIQRRYQYSRVLYHIGSLPQQARGMGIVPAEMALPVQNINHSAFRSMFEKEKLSGHVQKLRSMFEKQAGVEKFDLIQSFHACKQEEGKSVADYVLTDEGYVSILERLGYMLPQDISVGLILNGLSKDFVGFVRNYNMHNMGKTIGEIHAMLIEYEKGIPEKAETPQGKDKKVYIPKPNNPKPTAKERPAKDDACHHCKEVGHWKKECPVYLLSCTKKRKQCLGNVRLFVKRIRLDKLDIDLLSYAESLRRSHKSRNQWVGGRLVDLEEIQEEEDTTPSEITSNIPQRRWRTSRSWNKRFDEEIKRFGFAQNLDEPCVYQKASGSNVTFLILYVDDIIIMGNHIPSLQSVKDYLGKCFAMKDLGEAAFILGIKIYRDRSKRLIGLCQNAYMDKILKRYKMDNSKRGHIPMQERLDLNKSQGAQTPKEVNRMKNVPYASAVGSIMYAVRCTRPDVAFAQNMTSRFQQNPGEPHWTAVKNILKYLRNTKDMFLVYGGNPSTELRVECYCDAGFETDRDDTKSQTGYVFVLNGGAVDWKSSKQSTTAMSATESEYIAASEAAMEAVWIRKFISGLGIVPTINEPLNMYCDNSAAVHYANEPGVQKGARHYQRRYHYVRECVELGEIRILKVHTDNNLADPFTKALSNRKLTQHARGMGLRPASSFM